jgi:hypothetical protein
VLPSGLDIALSRDAIIEHDGNWFHCPEGHFWYWDVDVEIMGPPPFPLGEEIWQAPRFAKTPATREDCAQFIRVLEMAENGLYGWRGEWLRTFPTFQELSSHDVTAWRLWLNEPHVERFLDDTIHVCTTMAEAARTASGWARLTRPPEARD